MNARNQKHFESSNHSARTMFFITPEFMQSFGKININAAKWKEKMKKWYTKKIIWRALDVDPSDPPGIFSQIVFFRIEKNLNRLSALPLFTQYNKDLYYGGPEKIF